MDFLMKMHVGGMLKCNTVEVVATALLALSFMF